MQKKSYHRLAQIIFRAGLVIIVMAAVFGGIVSAVSASDNPQPVITVLNVVPNETIQVRIDNLPPGLEFAVTQSKVGNKGKGGLVAHFNSGAGGQLIATFEVHTYVLGETYGEIRIDDGKGDFAYTTFTNTNTPPQINPMATAVAISQVEATVKLHIERVSKRGFVIVGMENIPNNTDFKVRIGPAGWSGENSFLVASLNIGNQDNKYLRAYFEISQRLRYYSQLEVRIQGSGYLFVIPFDNQDFNY